MMRKIVAVALVACLASVASADLIAYWNFNDVSDAPTSVLAVSQGSGTLTTDFAATTNFGGTTINAIAPDANGQALALQGGTGNANNGKSIVFAISTAGMTDLVMTFATQRTSTGFNNNQIAYSADGGTSWTDFGAAYDPPSAFALQTVDFSTITALNNNANAQVRITFDGATTTSSNNRIDNVQFNAVPEPLTLAMLGLGGLFLRRRIA